MRRAVRVVGSAIQRALLLHGEGFGGHYGVAQRLALVASMVWVAALALGLIDL